jgi:hypothetical protein
MNPSIVTAVVMLATSFSPLTQAQTVELPLQLDYGLIKKVVMGQLYKGSGDTATVWQDKHQCSFVELANLKINGKNQQIQLLNDVQAQFGAHIGGQCLPFLKWQGILETWQKPTLSADRTVLNFPITQAIVHDQQGRQVNINQLNDVLKNAVEPALSSVKLDIKPTRHDMARQVSKLLPAPDAAQINTMIDTLTFTAAAANDKGVAVQLAVDAPPSAPTPTSAVFTDAEKNQWQTLWQPWEAQLSHSIQRLGDNGKNADLQKTLTQLLGAARTAFTNGLTSQQTGSDDPVRQFFNQSWRQLTPYIQDLSKSSPELESLRYLTFIAGTDLMYELENRGAPLGIAISSDGLRKLARLLIAGQRAQPVAPQYR